MTRFDGIGELYFLTGKPTYGKLSRSLLNQKHCGNLFVRISKLNGFMIKIFSHDGCFVYSIEKTGWKCLAKSSKFQIQSKSIPYDENLTMKLRHKFKTGAFSKTFAKYQLPLRRCRIIDFLLYYLNLCVRTAFWYHTKKTLYEQFKSC